MIVEVPPRDPNDDLNLLGDAIGKAVNLAIAHAQHRSACPLCNAERRADRDDE